MKVCVIDYGGRGTPIIRALRGVTKVTTSEEAEVILIDHDAPWHHDWDHLDSLVDRGKRIYTYPHGGGAYLMALYDNCYPIYSRLSGALVAAEGHRSLAKMIDYPHPVHVIGFPFCDVEPRMKNLPWSDPPKILFAASHPPMFSPWVRDWNQEAFFQLWSIRDDFDITIRTVGDPGQAGIEQYKETEHFRYVQAGMYDPTTNSAAYEPSEIQAAEIEKYDLVIGDSGTFSNIALARGVDTIMWGSTEAVADPIRNKMPDRFEEYADFIAYPLDLEIDYLSNLITQSLDINNSDVQEWRETFIWDGLQPELLMEAIS